MTSIEIVLLVILVILMLFIGVLSFFAYKKAKQPINAQNNDQTLVLSQISELKDKFENINKTFQDSRVESSKNMTELNQRVEGMSKFQRELNNFNNEIKTNIENINESAKNLPSISVELKDISDIYKHAKKRGNFGEIQLGGILNDIFGASSNLVKQQYQLKGGVVDFAIIINDNIVPIDSKFPLDNYKKLIDATKESQTKEAKTLFKRDIIAKVKEASKYISRVDGINDVIIFIPSEAIFGNIVDWYGNEILTEAISYNVFLSSPTTIAVILKLFLTKQNDKRLSENIAEIKIKMIKVFECFNNIAQDWNEYIKTLMTLTNKAKQLTHTNTQLLKKVKNIETDNQELLDKVDITIQNSIETKNQLEVERQSLKENQEE